MTKKDLSQTTEKLTNTEFKDMTNRINKYINDGGYVKPERYIYIDYPSETSDYITYKQYQNILERWNSYISLNNKEPTEIQIYVKPIDISSDDKILPITTFTDMESRVNRFLKNGGAIADTRAVYLKMSEMKEYITYAKYKEILSRVEIFRKANNRDPKFVYLVVQSNTNSSRPNAVGDNILPNAAGWYLSPRYKSNSSAIRQERLYWCADNMMQMLIYELTGKWLSESYLAKLAGTTTSGTGHDGINSALKVVAKKLGVNWSIEWKYFSDVGYDQFGKLIKDPAVGTGTHVLYKIWGHYEYCIGVNLNTKKCLVANSLSGGWLEYRSFTTETKYINGNSQKSILLVTQS